MTGSDAAAGQLSASIPLASLPDGGMTTVEVGDAEVLLARIGSQVYAVDNLCSHAEGWLDMGALHPATCEVECPMHEGRFDLRTGNPTREPCEEPIGRYPVTISDGMVHVSGEPA